MVERLRRAITGAPTQESFAHRFRGAIQRASQWGENPVNPEEPVREKAVSIGSEAELGSVDSGALKSSEGDKERAASRATTSPASSDISECTRHVVSNAVGMGLSRHMGSPVTVGFNRSSPTMEITSIRPLPVYTPEEKIRRDLRSLERSVKNLEEPFSLDSLSLYKAECESIAKRSKNLPEIERQKIVSQCRNIHGLLCTWEQEAHLETLEQSIKEQKGAPSLDVVKQLQKDCRAIYRSAKQCIARGEIEDRAHMLYMQLLDMETQSLPTQSDVLRNPSDDMQLQANIRQNMESYRELFDGSVGCVTPKDFHRSIVSVSKIKLSIPSSMNELFDKEHAQHLGDGAALTREEQIRLDEITEKLIGPDAYGEGVKKFLEFKANKLRILNRLQEIRSGQISDAGPELRKCYKNLKYMEQNKSIIGHISQKELSQLSDQCDQVVKELELAGVSLGES